ncbi:MAG TPA: hypothetical protein VE135_15370 [Pyrinomonadaceae bacterium]|nr:hypothetical protein [Pyrinomonadaceae bacterium]
MQQKLAMKCCHKYQRVYTDEGMNFCLDDGTALMSDRSMPGEFPTVRFASGRRIDFTSKEALPDKTLVMDLSRGLLPTRAGRRQATKPRTINSIAVRDNQC